MIYHRLKNFPTNDINIYTDGSVKKYMNHNDQRAGAGITISKHKEILFEQSYSLGSYPTINQCELFAINQAAHWLTIMNLPNTSIYIFSDSETTLHKLSSNYTKSKLVLETNTLLNKLCDSHSIELIKVPAHMGIEGNERADMLAKEGAGNVPIGPEPYISFNMSHILTELTSKFRLKQLEKIEKHKIIEKHKTPLISYLNKYHNKLAINNKVNLRLFTHMISDQSHLANNSSKRDPLIVPYCRHCPAEKRRQSTF